LIRKRQRSTEEEFPFDSIAEFIDFFRDKNWSEFVLHRRLLDFSRSQRYAQSIWKRWLIEKKRREKQEEIKKAHQREAERYVNEPIEDSKTKDIPADPRPDWKYTRKRK